MNRFRMLQSAVLIVLVICSFPSPALAYVGPGTGMTAIGVFLALAAGFAIALVGFVWYPIKRLVRMIRKRLDNHKGSQTT